MASVKVAVRLRPLNDREIGKKSRVIIEMDGKQTTITNLKVPEQSVGDTSRERLKKFSYDFSYWSVDKNSIKYASQQQIFQDIGMDVVNNACDGYNTCVFAYGQTGSGKTYTMMGNPGDEGLIPRSCQELFNRMKDESMTYRTEVSYLEIYNEKVRDLLKFNPANKIQHSLRVREHPKDGPYVQELSKHLVNNYTDIKELMDRGNQNRTTASTNMNDVSSRSHAIFTIVYTQAKFSKECPIETHSKVHLVDLAGSERADSTGATGQRLKEGGSINKSLVTLGNVISTLADMSGKSSRRQGFIPYRDSTLTWLLKDSLGGNAKTMMIATISPADCNYAETLSTLRYANRAKDIINKPTVNEDSNVKLIRELKAEIARLRALLGGHIDSITTPKVKEKLHENEARIKVLTEEWTGKWHEVANIFKEEHSLALRKEGMGVVLDSDLPHLIGIDDDLLSTGIMLYHLKEGMTSVGSDRAEEKSDIVLSGNDVENEHCSFLFQEGEVTLIPHSDAPCSVNGNVVTEPLKLSQGAVILLGQTNMFRFNHPAQVAKLREEYKGSGLSLSRISLSQSMTDLCRSTETLALATSGWEFENNHSKLQEQLDEKRQALENLEERYRVSENMRLAEQEKKEREIEISRAKLAELQKQINTTTGLDGTNIEEEKVKLKLLIEKELSSLLKNETLKIKQGQNEKDKLAKELSDLKEKYEKEKSFLEEEILVLLQRKEEIENHQAELQSSAEQSKQTLQDSQQALEMHKNELVILENVKVNPKEFSKLAAKLSENLQLNLVEENIKLCNTQNAVHEKEKEVFDKYQKQLNDIEQQKDSTLKDVAKEREQLEADKVYCKECEDLLQETYASGDSEALQREKQALEKEKTRIKEEEENLKTIELELDRVIKEDRAKVEEMHADEIENVNKERDRLKLYMHNWEGLINSHMEDVDRACTMARKQVSEHTEELEKLLLTQSGKQRLLKEEEEQLLSKINEMKRNKEQSEHAWKLQEESVEAAGQCRQQAVDRELLLIMEKKQALSDMNVDEIDNEFDMKRLWLKIQSTLANSNEDALKQLEAKIQELLEIEQRVSAAQREQEENQVKNEDERQEESDILEQERFELQDLEEQERINALVEQEIKRRLFEERVEREKQRHIEREREKAERERELNRIKRVHQQEISRLKEKIETSGGYVENTPTRANPYASVMSGDATPTGSISALRKTKANSRTNLARVQSNPSVSLPAKPIEVSIPGFVHRGSGFDTHIEFEVKLTVLEETWSVFRRYSKFRDLHNDLKSKFPEVGALLFPPKRWFGNKSDKVAAERRLLLENYLKHIIDILQTEPTYPLHPSHSRIYSKQVITEFHSFFKKGIFSTDSRLGTG